MSVASFSSATKRRQRQTMQAIVQQSSLEEESRITHAHAMLRTLSSTLMWKEASFVCSYLPIRWPLKWSLKREANPLALLSLALSMGKEVLVPLPDIQPMKLRSMHSVHVHVLYSTASGRLCKVPVPSAAGRTDGQKHKAERHVANGWPAGAVGSLLRYSLHTLPLRKPSYKAECKVSRKTGCKWGLAARTITCSGTSSACEYSISKLLQVNRVGIILVPGLAFSIDGARLGRGGGYYDRLLAKCGTMPTIRTVGICHHAQIVEQGSIRQEAHDIRMDYLLSENGLIDCKKG